MNFNVTGVSRGLSKVSVLSSSSSQYSDIECFFQNLISSSDVLKVGSFFITCLSSYKVFVFFHPYPLPLQPLPYLYPSRHKRQKDTFRQRYTRAYIEFLHAPSSPTVCHQKRHSQLIRRYVMSCHVFDIVIVPLKFSNFHILFSSKDIAIVNTFGT